MEPPEKPGEVASHPVADLPGSGARTPQRERSGRSVASGSIHRVAYLPGYPTPPGKLNYKRPSSAPSEVTIDGTGMSLTHTDRVVKSGWLLKAFGGVSLRTWKRRWVYLLDDRLCWAPEEGSVADVRYISLDRIPVRPAPRGYGPDIRPDPGYGPGSGPSHRPGITMVQNSMFPQSARRVGCMFSVTSGSKTHHFCSEDPADAQDWVKAVKNAWEHCITHSSRKLDAANTAEFQIHKEQRLVAQNKLLHNTVSELATALDHMEDDATRRLEQAGGEVFRLETMLMDSTQYSITVQTGNRKGAATDSNVYLELIGKGGGRSSGEVALMDNESGMPLFRRGQMDVFKVKVPYLGPIAQIKLWHDGTGRQPHWYVEGVKVVCAKNGQKFTFPCRQWFSTKVGDARLKRTLYAGRLGKPTTYEVKVFTSNLRGAGTDANVHLVMHGDKATSGRHILSSGPDDFERGARNVFQVDDLDIGKLLYVVIGHDNTGAGASWHLDHMVVTNMTTGVSFLVPGRCWFAVGHGDGAVERSLEVAPALEAPVEYLVNCVTSDMRGAGTDADVFVVLHGHSGTSPRIMLPSAPEDFERGTKSAFAITTPDVGDLQRLTISHNNKGTGPSWHLSYVEVVHSPTGNTWWFLCNQWLSATRGDGQLERTLAVSTANPEDALETYDVEFHTSDLRGAGTDANVHYILHGERDSSGRQVLKAPLEGFERGCRDVFVLHSKDLGTLQRLVVGHDNSGPGPSWHLDCVLVTGRRSGKTVTFPCRRWLSTKLDDGATERELLPAGQGNVATVAVWEVAVQTSDLRGAGTDASVFIELIGANGKIGPRRLEDNHDDFMRGKLDLFRFEERDIGKISSLELWLDEAAGSPSWHVQMVEVKNSTSGEVCWFVANRWLSQDAGLRATLTPVHHDPRTTMRDYQVLVYTGNLKGAGTDSGVTLEMIGTAGSSGPQRLTAQHDTFERGQCDEFLLRVLDVGALKQIIIKSDGKGLGASWYLDKVVIREGEGGEAIYFPASAWLRDTELEVVLEASRIDPRDSEKSFAVAVYTSNVRHAGTDSNVFVQITGNLGAGPDMQLFSTQRDAWERGQVDECQPITLMVGVPEKLRIWHDNSGLGPAWHLHQIVLTDQASGDKYFFLCDSWLDSEVGLERTLSASKTDPAQLRKEYEVQTVTSDLRGAGTDATVSIELHGDAGSSGLKRLENGSNADPFERNMTDIFRITCQNLGGLKSCRIGHDSKGIGASWHLYYVKVTELESGRSWYFYCDRWLDATLDDGLTIRELPASSEDPSKQRCTYKLRIHTGDVRGAGTDANVFVNLHGSSGDTGKKVLHAKGKEDFERGQVDTFDIHGPPIGNLERLRIGHDNKGIGASWHCKQVDVQCPGDSGWVTFPCNRWFDLNQDDGAIERELYPIGTDKAIVDNTYQIVVHTSDIKGAGTDAGVSVDLSGPRGKTGPLRLDDSKDNFERGKVDTFTVTAADVGAVEELRVWHDSKGVGAAWHLDMIEVYNTGTNTRYFFECNAWLDKAHGIEKTLKATPNDPKAQMVKYKITVHTSDKRGAGTDANVFIDIHGDAANSGKIVLDNSKNNFERGMIDEFVRETRNVGAISSIVIGHDAKGVGAAWHLEQVEVTELATGKTHYFDCREWLDAKHGTSRELRPAAADPRANLCKYKVAVKTSDVRGAGTDANVHIVVYGERGDTGKHVLDNSKDNFERNMLDTFFLEHADIGKIYKIKLGHDNAGMGAAWHCDTVEVVNTKTSDTAFFRVKNWFDKKQGDKLIEREYTLAGAKKPEHLAVYDVTFVTSDERGAGTDADVSIVLTGSAATFGPYKLDARAEHFERGTTDVFTVEAEDVGELQQLEVIQDGTGMGAAWLLASVEVYNRATGARVFFPCNQWLDKKHGLSRTLTPGRSVESTGCTYKLEIKTSDVRGAGTDANVQVKLIGEKAEAGPVKLTAKQTAYGSRNLFERNQLDVFTIKALPDTGHLSALEIGHDGAGLGAGWHLAEVHVHNLTTGEKAHAIADKWLDSKHGTTLKLPLIREEPKQPKRTPGKGGAYTVEVVTGDEEGAGNISEAFINIMSSTSKRETGPLALAPPGGRFDPGALRFQLRAGVDLADITHIEVGHDSPIGGWFLEHVNVTNDAAGQLVSFPCHRWMAAGRDDGSLRRTLRPEAPVTTGVQYVVEVATGEQSTVAGASAEVFVDVIGQYGRTGRLKLSGPSARFARGGVDRFTLPGQPEVGYMEALELGYGGRGGKWHVDWLQVTNTSTGDTAFFPANVVLTAEQPVMQCDASQTDREGNPRQSTGTMTTGVDMEPPTAMRSGYQVTFQTKRSMCSGATGTVSFDVTGERGSSGRITVESTKRNFRRGGVDSFFFPKLMFLGELTQVRVHLEPARGLGRRSWELESVTVTHTPTARSWVFYCNAWINKAVGFEVALAPSGPVPPGHPPSDATPGSGIYPPIPPP